MDLKEVEKRKGWILYLIDVATRYTAACLIRRKKKGLVVYCMCHIGILKKRFLKMVTLIETIFQE